METSQSLSEYLFQYFFKSGNIYARLASVLLCQIVARYLRILEKKIFVAIKPSEFLSNIIRKNYSKIRKSL